MKRRTSASIGLRSWRCRLGKGEAIMVRTKMSSPTEIAGVPEAQSFSILQRELAHFNRQRLEPGLGSASWRSDLTVERRLLEQEGDFVETMRTEIAPLMADIPRVGEDFLGWFEELRQTGPGQGDALFPWLASLASRDQ